MESGATATIDSDIAQIDELRKLGTGALILGGTVSGNVIVDAGGIGGGGTIVGDFTARAAGRHLAVDALETLHVSGTADIRGAALRVTDQYTQARGTTTGLFTALAANAIQGIFITFPMLGRDSHLGRGHFLDGIGVGAADRQISIYAAVKGDVDGDGTVMMGTDGGVLLSNLGKGEGKDWTDGDFDGDGLVTASRDAALLLAALAADQATSPSGHDATPHDLVFSALPHGRFGSTWDE